MFQEIHDRLDEVGGRSARSAQIATLQTRRSKDYTVPATRRRDDWRARAAEHGLGVSELRALIGRVRYQEPSPERLLQLAREMLGPQGLTEKQTAFSEPEALMAWAQAHRAGASAERVRRLTTRLVRTDGVEPVGEPPSPGRPARYSTRELVDIERAALALVERGREAGAPSMTEQQLDKIERADKLMLSDEQEAMVREAVTSANRVICVVGLAGAGKTTATHALTQVFEQEGIEVLGAAPSGVAAEKLQDETGIPTTTLHRLLDEARATGGLPRGSVLVVDEAGMAETRVLAPILELVERSNGKAVLIGDPYQLPAVGAGGLFAGIVAREGAVVLIENRRQRDDLERDALARVRAGVGRDYLAYAEKRERLVVSDSPVTTRARLLAEWWEHAREDLSGNVMLALRRSDVDDLNQLARALMAGAGRLGNDRVLVGDREFASGDRVVCLRNSDQLAVKNGTRGTIKRIDPESRTLVVATDRGPIVELSRGYVQTGNVRHAYALTGHAAQGLTVERAFVLGLGKARLQEWGYVALSRARSETRLYVTGTPREHESHFHDLDDRDPLTRFGRALEESAVEELAVDQHPLASGPRHEARPEIERGELTTDGRDHRRLLEHKQRALAKSGELAERKLQLAERELARSSRLHRRARAELRAEIDLQRGAVEMAREQLAATATRIEEVRRGSSQRPDRADKTEVRERGLVLER